MYRKSAAIYDLLYSALGKDYDTEAAEIHQLLLQHAPTAESLLDVACGTGRHMARLSRWYRVTGIDLSPQMLEIARELNPHAELFEANLADFDLGQRFDVAICLFSSIAYAGNANRLASALASIARHLVDGGVAVVDGWHPPEQWTPGRVFVHSAQNEEMAVVRMSRSDRVGDLSTMDWEFLVGTKDGISRFTERHELGLYTPDDWRSAFDAAGLEVLSETSTAWGGRPRFVLRRSDQAPA